MKTLATFVLCLSLLAGFTACDKNDDNMGTLIVEIRDNAKASVLNIYTEEGSLIYTNTEYLYQNDPRLSIPLNPGNYQMQLMYGFNRCSFQIRVSGGMRQRVVIAIALACDPKVLIADEPTTALDVTIQAQILDLMRDLQKKIKTSIIIITHNLGVVANIADRVAVMYGGKLVETGDVEDIFHNPCHEYTKGLLRSIPKAHEKGGELQAIPGTPPDLMEPPVGCPFAARCKETMIVCQKYMPDYTDCGKNHKSACWMLDEMAQEVNSDEK